MSARRSPRCLRRQIDVVDRCTVLRRLTLRLANRVVPIATGTLHDRPEPTQENNQVVDLMPLYRNT